MSGSTLCSALDRLSCAQTIWNDEKKLSFLNFGFYFDCYCSTCAVSCFLFPSDSQSAKNRFSYYIFYNLLSRHDIVVKYELLKCFNRKWTSRLKRKALDSSRNGIQITLKLFVAIEIKSAQKLFQMWSEWEILHHANGRSWWSRRKRYGNEGNLCFCDIFLVEAWDLSDFHAYLHGWKKDSALRGWEGNGGYLWRHIWK